MPESWESHSRTVQTAIHLEPTWAQKSDRRLLFHITMHHWQAIRRNVYIRVNQANVFPARFLQPDIIPPSKTEVGAAFYDSYLGELSANHLRRAIGGTIVHDNNLRGEISIDRPQRRQTFFEVLLCIPADDHDGKVGHGGLARVIQFWELVCMLNLFMACLRILDQLTRNFDLGSTLA